LNANLGLEHFVKWLLTFWEEIANSILHLRSKHT